MTWLKGQTTYANLADDLTKLACGEIADGSAVTCDSADKWDRVIAGQNCIQSPSSEDIALGNMSNRAGYWSMQTTATISTAAGLNHFIPYVMVCKQTTIWSGVPSTIGASGRWAFTLRCSAANTVAGVYNTATITFQYWDLDTGLSIQASTVAISSSGVVTLSFGGKNCTVTMTDPSGILQTAPTFYRGFSGTYLGGFDWLGPFYARRRSAATFSVNPPGTVSTDYDITSIGVTSVPSPAVTSNYTSVFPAGGMLSGIGVKTNTFLTGALYTYTHSMAFNQLRMKQGATAGQIDLEWLSRIADDGSGTYRQSGPGTLIAAWLRTHTTPGSVTSGSTVQYWMSVKPRKISIILNANPGDSGKLTCAMTGEYTPHDSTNDVNPVWCSDSALAYFATDNTQAPAIIIMGTLAQWAQRRADISAFRDWQTGYSRADLDMSAFNSTGSQYTVRGTNNAYTTIYGASVSIGQIGPLIGLTPNLFGSSGPNGGSQWFYPPTAPGVQQKPSNLDGKWWLYGVVLHEGNVASTTAGSSTTMFEAVHRGYIGGANSSVFWVPGFAWSSGDELTDTVSGKKYFLVQADYHGILCRMRFNTNLFTGGAAVLEE